MISVYTYLFTLKFESHAEQVERSVNVDVYESHGPIER